MNGDEKVYIEIVRIRQLCSTAMRPGWPAWLITGGRSRRLALVAVCTASITAAWMARTEHAQTGPPWYAPGEVVPSRSGWSPAWRAAWTSRPATGRPSARRSPAAARPPHRRRSRPRRPGTHRRVRSEEPVTASSCDRDPHDQADSSEDLLSPPSQVVVGGADVPLRVEYALADERCSVSASFEHGDAPPWWLGSSPW